MPAPASRASLLAAQHRDAPEALIPLLPAGPEGSRGEGDAHPWDAVATGQDPPR